MPAQREDLFSVSVIVTRIVQGVPETRNTSIWDSWSGGETDSEEKKFPRGGLQPEVALGGRKSVGNITTKRLYDAYAQDLESWLEPGVGRAAAILTKQPLDEDGNAFGRPRVYTAKLKTLTPPDHDSQSSDEAMLECVWSTNGTIA